MFLCLKIYIRKCCEFATYCNSIEATVTFPPQREIQPRVREAASSSRGQKLSLITTRYLLNSDGQLSMVVISWEQNPRRAVLFRGRSESNPLAFHRSQRHNVVCQQSGLFYNGFLSKLTVYGDLIKYASCVYHVEIPLQNSHSLLCNDLFQFLISFILKTFSL